MVYLETNDRIYIPKMEMRLARPTLTKYSCQRNRARYNIIRLDFSTHLSTNCSFGSCSIWTLAISQQLSISRDIFNFWSLNRCNSACI